MSISRQSQNTGQRQHWEQDAWNDHPALGGGFGATPKLMALKPGVAAPKAHVKETFFEKLGRFIAHPIKTLRGEVHKDSTMHGLPAHNATLASQKDQPSFFQGAGGGTEWWEGKVGATGMTAWDEMRK